MTYGVLIESQLDECAWGDFDGDGFSNMRESLFGSDPSDDAAIPACWAEYSFDGDVDGEDLAVFADLMSQGGCLGDNACACAMEDAEGVFVRFFSEDFGRVDCP